MNIVKKKNNKLMKTLDFADLNFLFLQNLLVSIDILSRFH